MRTALVFPHQLFAPGEHPALSDVDRVYVVEHDRFFQGYAFHIQKLILHRASLYAFYDELDGRRYDRIYIKSGEESDSPSLFERIVREGITDVVCADPYDHYLRASLKQAAGRTGIQIDLLESPYFISSRAWCDRYQAEHTRYHLHDFYVAKRKQLGILVDEDDEPVGGSWSFDSENRETLSDDVIVPEIYHLSENEYVRNARSSLTTEFPDAPGESGPFIYPTTRDEAGRWLGDFFRRRFARFGPYQDAIACEETFLFHSVLSPVMNTGLLTPREVVDRALAYADEHEVPLRSLEGFIRQIIGWREFMAMIYEREYNTEIEANFFGYERGMPSALYTGTTGLPPVDDAIRRVQIYAYTHHIERLMVLGNIMLLLRIDPDEVYRWFMELFIDAYDWVMVPNVYGMSQFADGGLFATKPYISSSNYIRKMSNYGSGEWCDVWDALYWCFVEDNREVFESNPRLSMMASHLDRMDTTTKQGHRRCYTDFCDRLF